MRQVRLAERSGDRDIGCVAAGCHQYAADARLIVAGIERPPLSVEPRLEPCAEVHGVPQRNADIAQITGGVPGGNVECAAKRDGEMLEIATHPDALGKDVECGFGRAGLLIIERHVVVGPVADILHPAPAGTHTSKKLKGDAGETVDLAIATAKQVGEHLVRQIADGRFAGSEIENVGEAAVSNESAAAQTQMSLWSDEACAAIAETVNVVRDGDIRLDVQLVWLQQVVGTRGVDIEERNHRNRGGNLELNVVSQSNVHRQFGTSCPDSVWMRGNAVMTRDQDK